MSHGGKRKGAGRKRGSLGISQEVKQLFTDEAETAAQAIIDISRNDEHQYQLKALEIILNRSIGQPLNVKDSAIQSYLSGELTGMQTALIIEANGGNTGLFLKKYCMQELKAVQTGGMFDDTLPEVIQAQPEGNSRIDPTHDDT